MLNLMETKAPSPLGAFSAAEMHNRIEAMKLAYSDLRRYDADPRTYDVPVVALLSKDYARKRAALIDPMKANCLVPAGQPVGNDTTYLTVVDKDGNVASWIQSLSAAFGSGVTVEGMGFELQNRGAGFTLDPRVRMSWLEASSRSTRLSRPSWSTVNCTSDSESWAALTNRWRMLSSFPISWITG